MYCNIECGWENQNFFFFLFFKIFYRDHFSIGALGLSLDSHQLTVEETGLCQQ